MPWQFLAWELWAVGSLLLCYRMHDDRCGVGRSLMCGAWALLLGALVLLMTVYGRGMR